MTTLLSSSSTSKNDAISFADVYTIVFVLSTFPVEAAQVGDHHSLVLWFQITTYLDQIIDSNYKMYITAAISSSISDIC